MGPRLRMQAFLPTPHMRLPTRSLESTTEVHATDEHPCEYGEDPEPLVPFDGRGLWGWNVRVRRQGLLLNFAHGREDGGLR
jgi:hypothetical protein